MSNSKDALDLYAKVEDLLGIKEYAPKLYSYYFEILKDIEFDSLLDIGCGSGEFLEIIDKLEICSYTFGIDRSPLMVELTKQKSINASNCELRELNNKFDLAIATFDMVNYLNNKEFTKFFEDLSKVINKNGYFVFDINTLFGLSELAVGNFIAQDKDRFVTIESYYEDGIYESYFTLFEKETNSCYKKSSEQINQYYHDIEKFNNIKDWKLEKVLPISLYEEDSVDKNILVLKKVLSI